jgi:hypothetical protein
MDDPLWNLITLSGKEVQKKMKRFGLTALVILFSMLVVLSSAHAEIYKWVDDKGAVHFTEDPATIPEKYRGAQIKQQEEKELQIQTIKVKMTELATAMSNVASAVAAYHEDLNSWPLFDHADAIAIQTSLGVPIPKNIISSITITSPTDDQVTITATITGIDSAVDDKALILRGRLTKQGILWYWDGTVPSIYIPNREDYPKGRG